METNPGPRRPVPTVCRLLSSNVRALAGNLSDLTEASPEYDILLCSETLVSDMRHVSEFLVSGFGRLVLLYRERMPRARGMAPDNCIWLRSVGCRPDHARGGILDLLMTDVPDLVQVSVVAPIGNSDHSSLSAVISMAQAVRNLCVSREVFLRSS